MWQKALSSEYFTELPLEESYAMASMLKRSVFVLLLLLFFCCLIQGAPRIIAPYPNNLYAIKGEKTKVTCVVEDTVSNPDEIVFVRKTRFGDINPIRDEGPSGRRYYHNETLGGGSKVRVTLHFNEVQVRDDSRYGSYECHGHSGGSQHQYGFTVTVIERSELPGIVVSNNVTAKLGDEMVLSCNLTISQEDAAAQTNVIRMMWIKEGRVIEETLSPRQQPLNSLKIDVARRDDGGVYACHLISRLRNVKEYNVTNNIYLRIIEYQALIIEHMPMSKKRRNLEIESRNYPY